MKEKFELFMGHFGVGIVVSNKAVSHSGNYKKIAHIRETGHIKWYIDPESYVPEKEKQRILQVATVQKDEWEEWFQSLPEMSQYSYLFDHLKEDDYRKIMAEKHSRQEQIEAAKHIYCNY